jgi:hypothetical protein
MSSRTLCHVYDTDAPIPASSFLHEFLVVYEDPDTHQQLDPIPSALSDSREENLFAGTLCEAELCNATLYMMGAQHWLMAQCPCPLLPSPILLLVSIEAYTKLYKCVTTTSHNLEGDGF